MREFEDQNENLKKHQVKYWDYFFTDKFQEAEKEAKSIFDLASEQSSKDLSLELQAKILLKRGLFQQAYDLVQNIKSNSGIKLFLEFLISGDLADNIAKFGDDTDSLVYKAQAIIFSRIYWGPNHLAKQKAYIEPDILLEQVFNELIDKKDYDRAILTFAQSIELITKDQEFGKDILIPVALEQLENLLALSKKAKYDSTTAKVYLLKAKLLEDKQLAREIAKDAEILFGKEQNLNGLAEVYSFYAIEFNEDEYYDKALKLFIQVGNESAQGFIYEALASSHLVKGAIQDAFAAFEKAEAKIAGGGIFENLGLAIQKLSLHAVKGEYKKIEDDISEMFKPNIPKLFRAQAAQILANTLIQIQNDVEEGKKLISFACDSFKELKKYGQLLHAQNIYFQILLLDGDINELLALGEEIIQLASRLGKEEVKATKYVDIAFALVRIGAEEGDLNKEKLEQAQDYFKKAIAIYQHTGNLIGEADVYQAMGNMYANIAKLEDSFQAFGKAKKLYKSEGASLQAAITATLIGILMLDLVVLNEQTYPVGQENFAEALAYFEQEQLLDLQWKNTYYLASLNEKYALHSEEEKFIEKTKEYYLLMKHAVEKYETSTDIDSSKRSGLVGVSIDDAFEKARRFFESRGDNENAEKFKR